MDEIGIKHQLDELSRMLQTRELPRFDVMLFFKPHVKAVSLSVSWEDKKAPYGRGYKHISDEAVARLFGAAASWAASLPSPEEARHTRFLQALSDAAEAGKAAGVDINPIVNMMQTLSKNALTVA